MGIGFASAGDRFATVDPYGFVVLWSVPDELATGVIPPLSTKNPSFAVALSPSGKRLLVAVTSSLAVVHDLSDQGRSERAIPVASPGDRTVRVLVFEDEQTVLVGDDSGRLTRWHLDGNVPREEIILQEGPPLTSISLIGGSRIVVGRGAQVDLVEGVTGNYRISRITEGLATVYSTAVSDDGTTLAVGFGDGAVRIWSLAKLDGQPILLNLHRDVVRSLAFDRSGRRLLSVGDDGTIKSSVIGAAQLAAVVCAVLWRDLDSTETASFFTATTPPLLPSCSKD
jgi:WD40 repeat protein